jgi:hypothetical protein
MVVDRGYAFAGPVQIIARGEPTNLGRFRPMRQPEGKRELIGAGRAVVQSAASWPKRITGRDFEIKIPTNKPSHLLSKAIE